MATTLQAPDGSTWEWIGKPNGSGYWYNAETSGTAHGTSAGFTDPRTGLPVSDPGGAHPSGSTPQPQLALPTPATTQPLPNLPGGNPGGPPIGTGTTVSTPSTPVGTSTVPGVDIAPYIPATSTQQQDIIKNAIAQSQGVAQQNVTSLQDILGPYVQSQVKNWTDPNSPDYQATMGNLNNFGRADANTFGQSVASRLAPLIGQNMMSLGTNALQPSFATQQGLVNSGAGTQSNLGLASLQRFIDQQNFDKQATLAKELADKGVPSNFQQGVGAGSSLLGGFGSFFQGLPGLKQVSGTWICTHLKKLNLATESEVEAVHAKLYPSIFRHPIHWLHYLYSAPRLIELCDMESMEWGPVKEVLIDAVLAEPDPEKAWQIYRAECQRLTLQYAPQLWVLEIV